MLNQIVYLPPSSLSAAEQIRKQFDETAITGLAISLRTHGMLQPIRARKVCDKLIITLGERRWRAALKAGLKEVPVIIDDKPPSESSVLSAQLIENLQRSDLLPLEKADAIDRLLKTTGWTAKEAGQRIGLSGGMISKILSLLTLPEKVRAELSQGTIALSTAYELAKVTDPAMQLKLAEEAAAGKLRRDDVHRKARPAANRPTSKGPRLPRVTAVLGNGRSVAISGADLSFESVISSLEEVLTIVRQARENNMDLALCLKSRCAAKNRASSAAANESAA